MTGRKTQIHPSQVGEPVPVLLWRHRWRRRPDVPRVDEAAVARDEQRRRLPELVAAEPLQGGGGRGRQLVRLLRDLWHGAFILLGWSDGGMGLSMELWYSANF